MDKSARRPVPSVVEESRAFGISRFDVVFFYKCGMILTQHIHREAKGGK